MKSITFRKTALAAVVLLFILSPVFIGLHSQVNALTTGGSSSGGGDGGGSGGGGGGDGGGGDSPGGAGGGGGAGGSDSASADSGGQDPQSSRNGLNSNCDPNGSGVGTGSGNAGCIPCIPVSQATGSGTIQAYIQRYKAQYKQDHPDATSVPTPIVCGDTAANPDANCDQNGCDLVKKYVNPTINVLSIIVGLMAVISIIIGAIQYITSTGDPQKVSAAKGRISKTIFAFIAYAFLYAFLQFIIPGGIF
jgi:hypothetical protein